MARLLSRYPYIKPAFGACAVAILTLLGPFANRAWSADSAAKPSIDYTVKVLTPANAPEAYYSTQGLEQWRYGLPIPVKDTIQITATALGGDQITSISTKLDGKRLADVSTEPWTETFGNSVLTAGDHVLQITTDVNKKNSDAKLTLNFTVVDALPASLIPPPQSVVTSVKGAQELLSQGTVASVDPTESEIVPPLVGNGGETAGNGVDIQFADNEAENSWKTGQSIIVNGELRLEVVPGTNSADKYFVYSIYRDSALIDSSTYLMPVGKEGILLQARTPTTAGLYPGSLKIYIWGVDKSKNYSAPIVANLLVKNN